MIAIRVWYFQNECLHKILIQIVDLSEKNDTHNFAHKFMVHLFCFICVFIIESFYLLYFPGENDEGIVVCNSAVCLSLKRHWTSTR